MLCDVRGGEVVGCDHGDGFFLPVHVFERLQRDFLAGGGGADGRVGGMSDMRWRRGDIVLRNRECSCCSACSSSRS